MMEKGKIIITLSIKSLYGAMHHSSMVAQCSPHLLYMQ